MPAGFTTQYSVAGHVTVDRLRLCYAADRCSRVILGFYQGGQYSLTYLLRFYTMCCLSDLHTRFFKNIYKGQKMFALKRSFSDRRSGKDRRKFFSLRRFYYRGPERRVQQDRRATLERRDGYVKIGKWSSVKIRDLKLAKYLQPH